MADKIKPQLREVVKRRDAIRLGLVWYFTGKPCKRGHIEPRLTSNGQCAECGREKFRAWRSENVESERTRAREWRTANPDKADASVQSWRQRNPDKVAEMARRTYRKNIVKRTQWQHEYNQANKDKILKRVLAWAAANPDKVKKNRRAWNERHPEQARENIRVQQHRRRTAEGKFTRRDIEKLFADQEGICVYCPASLADGFHIDHKVPLVKGGTNWPENLQLCCPPCNLSKNRRDHEEFVAARAKESTAHARRIPIERRNIRRVENK